MRLYASLFLFSLATPCFSQALIEHAAAASGGSVGALAGKPLGQSLGKILGNVEKTTAKAAKAKPEVPKTKEAADGEASRSKATSAGSTSSYPAFGPATASAGMPASSGGVTRQNRPSRTNTAALAEQSASDPLVAPVPPPIPVHHTSREEVVGIQPGTVRSDVLAKLGPPSSLVTIPDDGHLLEIMKYVSGNRWLGTVRLDNGSVVRVDSAQ